jgi:hypothetical protein
MQDRGDVEQNRRTLKGRRRYSVPLLRGSTGPLATRPLEAAHQSSATPVGGTPGGTPSIRAV